MRAIRRAASGFYVVLLLGFTLLGFTLLGSMLPCLATAGDAEPARWQGGPIPADKIYIPGEGRPPGFAPKASLHEEGTGELVAPRSIPAGGWMTHYRGASAHADANPAVTAATAGPEAGGEPVERETARKTFGIFSNVLNAVRD